MSTARLRSAPDRLASNVIRMEGARTYSDLEDVCHDIEAQHAAEGVSDSDRRAYELVKAAHVRRVARSFAA